MHYIVQENIFRESHYNLLLQTLERLELTYQLVRVYPFIDKVVELKDIPDIPPDNIEDLPDFKLFDNLKSNTFIFGSVKLARILSNYDIYPGSQINDNHDFEVYRRYYGDYLLNNDSIICKVCDEIKWKDKNFIRPTKDTKSFTGKVFNNKEDWQQLVDVGLNNSDNKLFTEDTIIQVCSVKQIQKEIRFWCVGGKIITGSQYTIGGRIHYDSYFEEEAKEFAQKMVDIYQPAEAFVIDICLTNDEWKIVEINCINCAGFYLCNMQSLVSELEYYFNKQLIY